MSRTLPAILALLLTACSGSGGGTSSSNGSATGAAVSASAAGTTGTGTGSGSSTGAASSGTGTGSSSGGGISAASFNLAFNQAYCDDLVQCMNWAPYIQGICSDGGIILENFADIPLAIDAGRVAFDLSKAVACLGAIEDAGCQGNPLSDCDEVLTGEVAAAGPCYAPQDCVTQGCASYDSDTCTAGVCQSAVGIGSACDCAGCGVCDATAGLVCTSSICAPAGKAGADCTGNNPACAAGLDCIGGTCTVLPVPLGQSCNGDLGECQTGAYCLVPVAAATGACTTRVALGQPCGEDPDHFPNAFESGDRECAGKDSVCLAAATLLDGGQAAGVCRKLSVDGESCTPPGAAVDTTQEYNDGCYVFLNCISGTCLKAPASGPCATTGTPCDPIAAFCDDAGACHAFVAPGGTCTEDSQCGLDAQCTVNGICQTDSPCSPSL